MFSLFLESQRENDRNLRRVDRDIERERNQLEREEKKLVSPIDLKMR
jgi:hypothetical protein